MGEPARPWTPKYKEERRESSNELSQGCGVADTPIPPGHPRGLSSSLSGQHTQSVPGICPSVPFVWQSSWSMHRHLSPDSPVGVHLPPLSPVDHSLYSSQSAQTLPCPLNPLQLEVGLPVALVSELLCPGPLPRPWAGAAEMWLTNIISSRVNWAPWLLKKL